MKNWYLVVACALTVVSVQSKEAEVAAPVTREVVALRTAAVNDLSRTLPCRMISTDSLKELLEKIGNAMDPEAHRKLLELQARATELQDQRLALLLIPGIDEKDPRVVYTDAQLVLVEKDLNKLLYDGGFFNWKTMLALGSGAIAGTFFSSTSWGLKTGLPYISVDKDSRIIKGIIMGLLVATAIEYSIRGRHSLIAGNAFSLAKFIGSVGTKFFTAVFGDGGYADRCGAALEKAFRSIGNKLDPWLDNTWATVGIGAVAAVSIGAVYYFRIHTPVTVKP